MNAARQAQAAGVPPTRAPLPRHALLGFRSTVASAKIGSLHWRVIMPSLHDGEPKKIVLLYNDRERVEVERIYHELKRRLQAHGVRPWMAFRDMTAFGTLFDNIEDAISEAAGSIIFLGPLGLGRFQRHIETGAVATELWLRGAEYGALLVHLASGLEVPRPLLRWSSVNHDGSIIGPVALAGAILQRFGLADDSAGEPT